MKYADPQVEQAIEVLQSFMAVTRATSELTRRNAESVGLTMLGMSIVNTLFRSPGLTLKELTERLQASKSTISVSVEGLVQAGAVTRVQAEGNRREVNVALTAEGEALARKSIRQAYSYRAMTAALQSLDEGQIGQLLGMHARIAEALRRFDIEAITDERTEADSDSDGLNQQ
ncbi:MarR family transcriptional regulator [Paenibacillus lycopersici]|uniref:MarR family transcriptional regulator n=1 Tax=Paenibacillus lycopersici TaxID=2704462 RepID=A0A6C0G4V0_9BACL|nr:MarR family transcriptional regulator [Paenibacillus lycopersici]QHT61900.1 MarR family transcriptional regulator [Paenibacillus lycopersici]